MLELTRKKMYEFLCFASDNGNKLFLKRKNNNQLEYGYITDVMNILFHDEPMVITVIAVEGAKKWSYNSINDVVFDGWVLD